MRRIVAAFAVFAAVVLFDTMLSQAALAADAPTNRIVVMYFHRTNRCPTCRKMGGYAEEAIKKGFADQIKSGKVEFHFVNFQDEKNEKLTKGYKVAGPTLIVAQVVDNKVKEFKSLTEMWEKVGDKDEFIKYVQSNVKDYLKAK
jgi:thiol-disulfide isomerase/thioredoxin